MERLYKRHKLYSEIKTQFMAFKSLAKDTIRQNWKSIANLQSQLTFTEFSFQQTGRQFNKCPLKWSFGEDVFTKTTFGRTLV